MRIALAYSERRRPSRSLEPAAILKGARNLEQFGRVVRRNFGLDSEPPSGGVINLAISTNQVAVQIAPNG